MDTLPEDIELEDIEEEDLPTNTFLAYDEQIAGMNDNLEAMRQAVHIILTTKRFNYQIYTENFGIELDDLIGEEPDYIESVLPDRIREAFSIDDRILSEQNYVFNTVGDTMTISFDVVTVFGTFSEEVEI
jgi:hypothetical protein